MQIVGILVVILLVSAMVQSLTEAIFSPLFDKISKLTPYKWTLMYIALVAGVGSAFFYRFDLVSIVSKYAARIALAADPNAVVMVYEPGAVGIILTGLAIGKGANYIHQLISTYFPSKEQKAGAVET